MRNTPFWWILIGLMVLVDTYFFQALKVVAQSSSGRTRTIIYSAYWAISIAAILILVLLPLFNFERGQRGIRTTLFAIISGLFFAKLVACVFFLVDDIRRGVQWLAARFSSPGDTAAGATRDDAITRSAFLSWTGMVLGGGLFGTLVHGFSNRYRYQVRRVKLSYANLPAAFRGLKVVHISDIHSGSFNDKNAVLKGVHKILKEKPDLILFTGDLVNNTSDEMDDYIDVFQQLHAPMGVYATLGNHDYGDYVTWESPELKEANLQKLKEIYEKMGWRLLMNEHVVIEKAGDEIALIGIENWSAKARFPKYGDLAKAHEHAAAYPFQILMSHDPSHWKAEVLESYPTIDLMLSGHTHGMQFGLEVPGFKWSPIKYMYSEWAGLYQQGNQKLYVNRGFGFLGYPGRVGILPEITVLQFI